MAERVGFEPTCRLPDKTLSRRPRYDHFGTSPGRVLAVRLKADPTYDKSCAGGPEGPPLRTVCRTVRYVRQVRTVGV